MPYVSPSLGQQLAMGYAQAFPEGTCCQELTGNEEDGSVSTEKTPHCSQRRRVVSLASEVDADDGDGGFFSEEEMFYDDDEDGVDESGKRGWGVKRGFAMKHGVEIFVGGLTRSTRRDMLRDWFHRAGEITEVRIARDKRRRRCRGYGYVRFATSEEANRAIDTMHRYEFKHGRFLGVLPSDENRTLFVGNLKEEWTREELCELLQVKMPGLKKVEPIPDKEDNTKIRTFCFLEFNTHEEAAAIYNLHHHHPSTHPQPEDEGQGGVRGFAADIDIWTASSTSTSDPWVETSTTEPETLSSNGGGEGSKVGTWSAQSGHWGCWSSDNSQGTLSVGRDERERESSVCSGQLALVNEVQALDNSIAEVGLEVTEVSRADVQTQSSGTPLVVGGVALKVDWADPLRYHIHLNGGIKGPSVAPNRRVLASHEHLDRANGERGDVRSVTHVDMSGGSVGDGSRSRGLASTSRIPNWQESSRFHNRDTTPPPEGGWSSAVVQHGLCSPTPPQGWHLTGQEQQHSQWGDLASVRNARHLSAVSARSTEEGLMSEMQRSRSNTFPARASFNRPDQLPTNVHPGSGLMVNGALPPTFHRLHQRPGTVNPTRRHHPDSDGKVMWLPQERVGSPKTHPQTFLSATSMTGFRHGGKGVGVIEGSRHLNGSSTVAVQSRQRHWSEEHGNSGLGSGGGISHPQSSMTSLPPHDLIDYAPQVNHQSQDLTQHQEQGQGGYNDGGGKSRPLELALCSPPGLDMQDTNGHSPLPPPNPCRLGEDNRNVAVSIGGERGGGTFDYIGQNKTSSGEIQFNVPRRSHHGGGAGGGEGYPLQRQSNGNGQGHQWGIGVEGGGVVGGNMDSRPYHQGVTPLLQPCSPPPHSAYANLSVGRGSHHRISDKSFSNRSNVPQGQASWSSDLRLPMSQSRGSPRDFQDSNHMSQPSRSFSLEVGSSSSVASVSSQGRHHNIPPQLKEGQLNGFGGGPELNHQDAWEDGPAFCSADFSGALSCQRNVRALSDDPGHFSVAVTPRKERNFSSPRLPSTRLPWASYDQAGSSGVQSSMSRSRRAMPIPHFLQYAQGGRDSMPSSQLVHEVSAVEVGDFAKGGHVDKAQGRGEVKCEASCSSAVPYHIGMAVPRGEETVRSARELLNKNGWDDRGRMENSGSEYDLGGGGVVRGYRLGAGVGTIGGDDSLFAHGSDLGIWRTNTVNGNDPQDRPRL